MIEVRYFASLREELEIGSETMDATPDMSSLIEMLRSRGGVWEEVFGGDQLLMMAVNQEMANSDTALSDGDEVAFFPPVTGG